MLLVIAIRRSRETELEHHGLGSNRTHNDKTHPDGGAERASLKRSRAIAILRPIGTHGSNASQDSDSNDRSKCARGRLS